MALTGSYGDLYVRQYKDMIEHELQQRGSVLRPLVQVESVMGERTYFPKLGKASSYEVTGRNQDVEIQAQTNERRLVTPKMIEAAFQIEALDMLRYQSSPQPELVDALVMELGRQIDLQIITALAGSAGRELDGSTSNASFDSNNTIAVNTNTFGSKDLAGLSLTGDTGLHEGKLQKSLQLLQTGYALSPGDEIFVLAPAMQLAGLRSRVVSVPGLFFKGMPKLDLPMADQSLDGLLGMRFIQYENTGVDSSSDQYVYIFVRKALKFGVWKDVEVNVTQLHDKKGSPIQIKASVAVGAVRMWEEAAIRALCDPTPTYSVA